MKSLKSTKLLVLIISAALLVAGIVGISASADDSTPSLEIYSKNLSYGGTISIAFAVDAQNVDAEAVELLIYSTEPTEGAAADYTVTTSEAATVHEREALVFLTPGIAAKDMTKQIYVKAHAVVNGADVYSETERYSIAEYAYDMQYRSKINDNFIKLGAALLEVGEQIQTLLPYNEDNSPQDFVYIAAEGGTVDGKYNAGLFKSGENFTLNYTGVIPAGKAVVWTSESSTVANGTETPAGGHGYYVPSLVDAYVPGIYYNDADQLGARYDVEETITGYGSLAGFNNNVSDTYEPGTTYIVETDFTYNGGTPKNVSNNTPAFFGLLANDSLDNKDMFLGTYIDYADDAGNAVTIFGRTFTKGTTYNIRFEYTVGDGNYTLYDASNSTATTAAQADYLRAGFKFYVNNVEVEIPEDASLMIGENLRATANADRSFWGLGLKVRNSSYVNSDFSVTFDNVFIAPGQNGTSYFDNTDIEGTRLDFAEADDINGIFAESTHSSNGGNYGAADIVDGALSITKNPSWYGLLFKNSSFDSTKTYANGTKYVFEADITFDSGLPAKSTDMNASFIGFVTRDPGSDVRNGDMATYAYLKYENGGEGVDMFGANVEKGATHKITVVYTVGTTSSIEVFVDLVKIADCPLSKTTGVADTNCAGFGFYFRGGVNTDLALTFDNVFVGVIEAE